jgi:anti-sigma factor RsiW
MAGCNREWFENISAWHDGEVTAADAERIEAHLAGCAACHRVAELLGRVRSSLVAGGKVEVSPRVRARAESVTRPARRRLPWIALGGVAVAAAAALLLSVPVRGISPAMADELVSHHVRGFAREHPCDFDSSEPGAVSAWLQASLGYAVTVTVPPDATLLGARLCRIEGARTAALMYSRAGEPLTVFVPPPDSEAAKDARAFAGRGVRCTRGPLGNSICARSDEQPMLAVAETDAAALAPALGGR